jgi:hypothetical protein
MLTSWQFWAAVIVVVAVSHLVIGFVMPKLSGGGS